MSRSTKQKDAANVQHKWYVEIDSIFQETGEIVIIGEPIDVAEVMKTTPKGNFEIAYMSALFEIFDKLGGKRYKVLEYILKHKDSMNCLNITNTELAEKVGCSRPVVIETIKILTDAGIVTRKGTVLALSPKVFVKGNAQREGYIMSHFREMQESEKPMPGQLRIVGTDMDIEVEEPA